MYLKTHLEANIIINEDFYILHKVVPIKFTIAIITYNNNSRGDEQNIILFQMSRTNRLFSEPTLLPKV